MQILFILCHLIHFHRKADKFGEILTQLFVCMFETNLSYIF